MNGLFATCLRYRIHRLKQPCKGIDILVVVSREPSVCFDAGCDKIAVAGISLVEIGNTGFMGKERLLFQMTARSPH